MTTDGSNARSYLKYTLSPLTNLTSIAPRNTRPWFTCTELASIYNCPAPNLTLSTTIGVISLGGGLFGSLDPSTNILTNGDIQQCWTSIGIPTSNQPKVIIKTLGGSINSPTSNTSIPNYAASIENTIDITTIGAWYPSPNLTIIMYLADQYTVNNAFYTTLDYAINSNVVVGSNTYRPSTISVSWGFPEIYNTGIISQISPLLSNAASRGINIFCATGDNGSTNGIPGSNNYTDFPSSSPYVIACGGTRLICPNLTYDASTVETAWLSGGGGVSRIFPKPSYQSNVTLSATNRCTPDIALNADPATAVYYVYNNTAAFVGGTSIVSPAMAGLTAVLNINYFLNNKLYIAGSNGFHDITQGTNGGYNATAGYDLCTGRGSINGINLQTALMPVPTTKINLNAKNKSIKLKTSFQFVATVLPTNATNKTVNWSSSKPKIASISASGLCRALKIGTTIITASQGGINTRVNVNVKAKLSKIMYLMVKIDEMNEINLISNDKTYTIVNNSRDIVESVFENGSISLKGIDVGVAKILVEDEFGNEYATININVI